MVQLDNNPLSEIPQEISIPDLTTATIETYYPKIDERWVTGTQLATLEGVPYSRTFSTLSFPSTLLTSTVSRVELGHYSEDYEGDFYYRVASYFIENVYNSSVSMTGNKTEDFLRWNYIKNKVRQEEIYAHQIIKTLTWNRPSTPTNPADPTEDPIYSSLPNPYTIPLINTGKAIRARVSVEPSSNNDDIEIRLKSSPSDPGTLVTGTFYLTKEFIEIKLIRVRNAPPAPPPPVGGDPGAPTGNGGQTSHHKVTIDFYGKFKWRTFAPAEVLDQRTLIHPVNATRRVKLRPPGRANQLLNDKFWNSRPDNIILENFIRKNKQPSFE